MELENELKINYRRLQSIVEEYEANREEMRAGNEEMQSSNEELRSTMEEIETSKEELQSINEELQTVNQENRHKVEELSQLSSDVRNLLVATNIATLFLDRDLRILRFTPQVATLFNVKIVDRGRPLSDLTHRLGYEQLLDDAVVVLGNLVPIEREIQDDTGKWYLTRISPYRSTEDRIEGIVIAFIDISTQKNAEDALRSSMRELFAEGAWLRTILDSLSDGIIVTDAEARLNYLNPVAEQWTGWLQSEALRNPVEELYDLQTTAGETVKQRPLQRALGTAAEVGKERFILKSRDGQTVAIEESTAPILVKGRVEGAVAMVSDIRERLLQERKQEIEHERLEDEVLKATSELGQTRSELRSLAAHLMTAQEEERRRYWVRPYCASCA